MEAYTTNGGKSEHRNILDKHLEEAGWGLFFLLTGGALLLPGTRIPFAIWLTGVGAILLGLSAVGYWKGLRPTTFTLGLGVIAVAGGIGEFLAVDVPILALFVILVGIVVLAKPLTKRTG